MDNEDLKELDAIFKDMGGVEKIEDYTNNYENLPDGDYDGEIEKFETKNSKSTGKPMAVITVAVEGGRKEFVYMMLAGNDIDSTRRNVARAISQLQKLGVEGTALSDFLRDAEKLVGTRVVVTVKTSITKSTGKEYRNVDLKLA